VFGDEVVEALAQLGVAGGGLGNFQPRRGRLQVVVACGVDADANVRDPGEPPALAGGVWQ
jgi:hypothetical protein